MSSMLSIRGSDETVGQRSSSSGQVYPSNLVSLLAATGSQLPVLPPENLAFVKAIGKGSSFEVNKMLYQKPEDHEWSSYYVAVKRMIVVESDTRRLRRHYDTVHRELRVLTHPGLRDHDNILPILALGWTDDIGGACPYLMVEWSDHGTLTHYLQRIRASLEERCELALDIASGLQAPHQSKIIHGDMKPSNIIIFDTVDVSRPQMARLADFGGSIFEMDEDQDRIYGGTALYNAPEQEGRGPFAKEGFSTYQDLYKADVYSFGLVIWEILKNGNQYIDKNWLEIGVTELVDALQRICTKEQDGLLERANDFCGRSLHGSNTRQKTVVEALNLTLKDNPEQRASMRVVIQALTRGAHTQRPKPAYPNIKIHPPLSDSVAEPVTPKQANGIPRAFSGYKLVVKPFGDISNVSYEKEGHHPESDKAKAINYSSQLATVPSKPPPMGLSKFRPHNIDLFQMAGAPSPPWHVQRNLFQSSLKSAHSSPDPTSFERDRSSEASLQLAICYHIGFGIQRNAEKTLEFLYRCFKSGDMRLASYGRVADTLMPEAGGDLTNSAYGIMTENALEPYQNVPTYFGRRLIHFERNSAWKTSICSLSNGFSPEDPNLKEYELSNKGDKLSPVNSIRQLSESDLSKALYLSCKKGDTEVTVLLCYHCKEFIPDSELPTPLHWLIMFEDQHVDHVASALVLGAQENSPGPCSTQLNDFPISGHGVFFFAEHCAEFFGTPLHWAVRARRPKLVEALVRLGADINKRWSGPKRFSSDVSRPSLPYLSPLDLAAVFHLPEIIKILLDLGAEVSGGAFEEVHSAFQCIGLSCVPFSRYIVHGRKYREAMKEKMNVFTRYGHTIHEADSNGYDPLLTALRDADCEAYVIEELLKAGAQPDRLTLDDDSNAAVLCARNSIVRRHNVSSLSLVAAGVDDINARDKQGRSAIHYAAIGGSNTMAEILIKVPRFDINAKALCGRTALHFAAEFGSEDVISLLLQNGADREASDKDGLTALQLAAFRRKIHNADTLLNMGAKALFLTGTKPMSKGSVLHAAAAGASSAETVLKPLLDQHPRLREPAIINAVNGAGWTPLHQAAYFGDCEATYTLLYYGADRSARDSSRAQYPGRTALDKVMELLKQIEARGLGRDHKRIKTRGPQAANAFVESSREIKRLLENERAVANFLIIFGKVPRSSEYRPNIPSLHSRFWRISDKS
ncbi:hypothetical protein ACLMJK_001488 [Lecanora helva]